MGSSWKLLHIITGLAKGGAEAMFYKLLSRLDKDRFEVSVISLTEKGTFGNALEELEVPVFSLGLMTPWLNPLLFWQLIRLTRSFKPDLIHGWMYHGNIAALATSTVTPGSIPVVWNIFHTPTDLRLEKRMTAFLIRLGARLSTRTARIIYDSRAGALRHETLGYAKEKTVVIPNGFDCDHFAPSKSARLTLRKSLGLKEQATLIGLIGRYHPAKDFNNFIKAASLLAKKKDDVYFVLVGREVDKSNVELMQLIQQAMVEEKTYLLGERLDINEIVAGLDILTSSSCSESFSNVIGEAMACGVPCVVTDVGDSAWLVGETGVVVKPRNPEALASGWEKLLELKFEERRKVGLRARQRVMEHFSLETVVGTYKQVYEEILVKHGKAREACSLTKGER
jgi:glycosyltransferase involved in cell wall biosynthesis